MTPVSSICSLFLLGVGGNVNPRSRQLGLNLFEIDKVRHEVISCYMRILKELYMHVSYYNLLLKGAV